MRVSDFRGWPNQFFGSPLPEISGLRVGEGKVGDGCCLGSGVTFFRVPYYDFVIEVLKKVGSTGFRV